MRHLLVMDPLEKLDPTMDTSLKLGFALAKRGHKIVASTPWQLYWSSFDKSAWCHGVNLNFSDTPESASYDSPTSAALTDFASIHMRKDPPFDMKYIAATWLLETAPHVFNSPAGLRKVNEKAIILRYPEFTDAALISADANQLLQFYLNDAKEDAILKPLDLYSGKGIHRLESLSEAKAKELLTKETNQNKELRLIQPFNPAIFDGEVRSFYIGGEPLAWCVKKPADGNFMANSSFGSTRHPHTPTALELERCGRIAKDLLKEGITIVGFDLIGELISEVNVTSPRLLTASHDTKDYFEGFAEWLIAALHTGP